MNSTKPASTEDLLPSERGFLAAMQAVGFGWFKCLQIRNGELVLDPCPAAIRKVKFGAESATPGGCEPHADFELKRQVAEFFEYTRSVDVGEIRTLEVRHGLPFAMEIELPGGRHA